MIRKFQTSLIEDKFVLNHQKDFSRAYLHAGLALYEQNHDNLPIEVKREINTFANVSMYLIKSIQDINREFQFNLNREIQKFAEVLALTVASDPSVKLNLAAIKRGDEDIFTLS